MSTCSQPSYSEGSILLATASGPEMAFWPNSENSCRISLESQGESSPSFPAASEFAWPPSQRQEGHFENEVSQCRGRQFDSWTQSHQKPVIPPDVARLKDPSKLLLMPGRTEGLKTQGPTPIVVSFENYPVFKWGITRRTFPPRIH